MRPYDSSWVTRPLRTESRYIDFGQRNITHQNTSHGVLITIWPNTGHALVLWWTIKQGQFLLCDVKQKHYVVVQVSELSLGLQVLTWFIFLSSRTTAVVFQPKSCCRVFVAPLWKCLSLFLVSTHRPWKTKYTNPVSTKLPFTKRRAIYLLRKPALICLRWSLSLVKTLLAGLRRVLGSCQINLNQLRPDIFWFNRQLSRISQSTAYISVFITFHWPH